METLPFGWANEGSRSSEEAMYAKISDDLRDIAIKWGGEIQGENHTRIFHSKRFGMGLEVSIYTKKDPKVQTVFVHKGTNTGGFRVLKIGKQADTMIHLDARTVEVSTPGGIVYPVTKEEGAIIFDSDLSFADLEQIIVLIDNIARQKGLIDKNGERIASPELIKLTKDKYKVSEVFKERGVKYPLLPGMDPAEAINEFDRPKDLVVRDDSWGGILSCIVKREDVPYFDRYDQVLNDILIERSLTMQDLHQGLRNDELTFVPLIVAIREEVERRMAKLDI